MYVHISILVSSCDELIFSTILRKSALGLGKAHLEVALRKTWKVEVSNSKREMLNFLLV